MVSKFVLAFTVLTFVKGANEMDHEHHNEVTGGHDMDHMDHNEAEGGHDMDHMDHSEVKDDHDMDEMDHMNHDHDHITDGIAATTSSVANATKTSNTTTAVTQPTNVTQTNATESHNHSHKDHEHSRDGDHHSKHNDRQRKRGAAPKKKKGSWCGLSDNLSTVFRHTMDVCKAAQSHLHKASRQEFLRVKSANECARACKTFDPVFGCKGFTYSAAWQRCFLISSERSLLNRAGFEAMCTGAKPFKHCTSLSVSYEKLPAEKDLPTLSWPEVSGINMSTHQVGCDPLEKYSTRLTSFKRQKWLSSTACSNMCLHYKPCAGSVFKDGECVLFKHFKWRAKCNKSGDHRINLRHCEVDGQQGPCTCGDSKHFCKKDETCMNNNVAWSCVRESKSDARSKQVNGDASRLSPISLIATLAIMSIFIGAVIYCAKEQRKNNRPIMEGGEEDQSTRQVNIAMEEI